MQQIFNFIFKNSNKLLFLLLLGTSFALTIQSHSYHKSKVINSANFLSGGVYQKINDVDEYFNLKTHNDDLAKENARLKMMLFNKIDTSIVTISNNIPITDKTNIILSKVIRNSFTNQENYITINTGEKLGVKTDMGVINDQGIVGIIENTSQNYATIQSILNIKSKLNAKLKKSNHFGTLTWDGNNTGFVQLIDVPRLASVRKGDTIVTGSDSRIFPENINIGTINNVFINKENNYYTLNIKLFNDMTNLGYVYIIKKKETEEIKTLEEKTTNE